MILTLSFTDRTTNLKHELKLDVVGDAIGISIPPQVPYEGQKDWKLPGLNVTVNSDAVVVDDDKGERLFFQEYTEMVADAEADSYDPDDDPLAQGEFRVTVRKQYHNRRTCSTKELTGWMKVRLALIEISTQAHANQMVQEMIDEGLQTSDPRIKWEENFTEGDGWDYIDFSFEVVYGSET